MFKVSLDIGNCPLQERLQGSSSVPVPVLSPGCHSHSAHPQHLCWPKDSSCPSPKFSLLLDTDLPSAPLERHDGAESKGQGKGLVLGCRQQDFLDS